MSEDLAAALERFNRKERNLLMRKVLGHSSDKPTPIASKFRREIADAIGCVVSEDAWWATDYHISWLAGAIAVYVLGDKAAVDKPFPNDASRSISISKKTKNKHLVEGNQEDIDLVVAVGSNLILVEVKAYGTFTGEQISSKVARLSLLREFYETLQERQQPASERSITFHALLMSPSHGDAHNTDWQAWLPPEKSRIALPLKLDLPVEPPVLEVNRCNERGKRSAKGDRWAVKAYPAGA